MIILLIIAGIVATALAGIRIALLISMIQLNKRAQKEIETYLTDKRTAP